ncbi:MAG: hypothetical protein RIC36_02570 [Rhodospirillales bacterium]
MNPVYQGIARAGGIDLHSQISRHQLISPEVRKYHPELPAGRILAGWFISRIGRRLKARGEALVTTAEKLMHVPSPLLR